jgi:ATP-binding cassette subfamily B protein
LRQANIVILDEPTSAVDSWTEGEWLARFRQLVAGRTAIIITHRFTTAMQADVIHVMERGQVVESGSHAELCMRGGRYAQSWRQQVRDTQSSDLQSTLSTSEQHGTNGYSSHDQQRSHDQHRVASPLS